MYLHELVLRQHEARVSASLERYARRTSTPKRPTDRSALLAWLQRALHRNR